MVYRYVGHESTIGDRRLSKFGQIVEFSDGEIRNVGGVKGLPVLTEEEFQAVGFTDADLRELETPASRLRAGAVAIGKMNLAQQRSLGEALEREAVVA